MAAPNGTITVAELAKRMGVSTHTIYEQIKLGTCPVESIRFGRRIVFPEWKVDALLKGPPVEEPKATVHIQLSEGLPKLSPRAARAFLRILEAAALAMEDGEDVDKN
jgi:excisionase family DNA binding protein